MYELNLANNITRLRHERKITQEELADFMGVTKASVSKWENAQSTPDLMLLCQLAAQFYYQSAVAYGLNGKNKEVLESLCGFEKCINGLVERRTGPAPRG